MKIECLNNETIQKNIAGVRQLNLSNVLEGRIYTEEKGWHDMDDITQEVCFTAFKEFLLNHCRIDSKVYNTIKWNPLARVKENNCGIFRRLIIENDCVSYIAGQDYTEEIKTLKKQFQK